MQPDLHLELWGAMGVEQVSLFLYAARWTQSSEPGTDAVSSDGQPVQVVSPVPLPTDVGPVITAADLLAWLKGRGFEPASWGDGSIVDAGRVRSMFGDRQAFRIHVHDENGEVAELYCRFTLPMTAESPLPQWTALVTALLERHPFKLDGASDPCDVEAFTAAVRRDENYKALAAHFGWESA